MKIEKYVRFEQAVEIEVSIDDIVSNLPKTADNCRSVVQGIGAFMRFLKSTPDALLETLNPAQREIIIPMLREQLERLEKMPVAIE